MKLLTKILAIADKTAEYELTFPENVRKFTLRLRSGNDLRVSGEANGTDDGGNYYTLPGGAQNFDLGELSGKCYVRGPAQDADVVEMIYFMRG